MSKKDAEIAAKKEHAMKTKGFAAAFAAIVAMMITPVQAEVIADQSRISIGSPMAPSFDKMFWHSPKNAYLNY